MGQKIYINLYHFYFNSSCCEAVVDVVILSLLMHEIMVLLSYFYYSINWIIYHISMCRKAFLTKDPSISSSKVTMSRRYKSQLITYRSPYITFFLLHFNISELLHLFGLHTGFCAYIISDVHDLIGTQLFNDEVLFLDCLPQLTGLLSFLFIYFGEDVVVASEFF